MRIALLFFALLFSVQFEAKAQQYVAGTDAFIPLTNPEKNTDPKTVKPPTIHVPEISQRENSILFSWDAVEKPLRFESQYEIKIFQKTSEGKQGHLLFQNITRENNLKIVYPQRFLNTGTEFTVIVNSRLTGVGQSYLIRGEATKLDFSYIPDCTPPKNVRVGEITRNSVTIEWDGAEATSGGIQYEVRYGDSTRAKEVMSSLIVESGLSKKIEGLETNNTYKFHVRKICNAVGAETSKWVEVQQALQRTIALPDFNCGDAFQVVDYDSLREACFGHPEYTISSDGIFYIGGFPIFLEQLSWENCEETETPLTETNHVVIDTIYDTIFCINPITEEYLEDSIEYRDSCVITVIECWYKEYGSDNPDYKNFYPCGTVPNVVGEAGYGQDTSWYCFPYPYLISSVTYLDTIGWDTFPCGGDPELVWGEQIDTTGWEILQCGCTYSGEGIVPLPFLDEKVRVEFHDVPIKVEILPNNEYKLHIVEGKVHGMWDAPPNRPSYEGIPGVFGEDICIVTPSQNDWHPDGTHITTGTNVDPNGFTQDGQFVRNPPYPGWQPGDPVDTTGTYDQWGYDANGIHRETGTANNPNGCTREQLTSQPQQPPCDTPPDPYEWLNTDPMTQSGLDFVETVKDTMDQMITRILNQMKTEAADSLNHHAANCQGLRSAMDILVGDLNYDRVFVFGPGDAYFDKGMHEKFSKEPKVLGIHLERLPKEQELEEKHVALYHCDKKEVLFTRMDSIITELLTRVPALKTEILERLKRLSADEIQVFKNDINTFETWVNNYLNGETESIYQGEYSFIEVLPTQEFYQQNIPFERDLNASPGYNPVNMMAGINDDMLNSVLSRAFENQEQEIEFQIKQGWKKINGIERAYFLEKMAENRKTAALTGMITDINPTLMPIVVANRGADGKTYSVYLDNIVFTPFVATMDAHIVLDIPNTGQKIAFVAYDVEFHPTGTKVVPVKLQLDSDVPIRLSNAVRMTLKGGDNTFVSFDCGGFAGLGIEAEVEICREYVKPYDEITDTVSEDPEDRVSGSFITSMKTWGDFYLALDIDPFVVTGTEDVKWLVDGVIFDFSDTKSPGTQAGSPLMPPPADYPHPFAQGNKFDPLWKGFYINLLEARLPNKFSDDNTPINIWAENLVIDDLGFSGHVGASNILPLHKGNAGGWAFSVDDFSMTIINNHIKDATLDGKINVPLFKNSASCGNDNEVQEIEAQDCFDYQAFLEFGNKYHFAVDVGNNGFCIDMMKAGNLNLSPESGISMNIGDDGFDVEANLSGRLSIGHDFGGGKEISAGDIDFQNLVVRNKPTASNGYIDPGTWSFPQGAGIKLAGFGLTLEDIALYKSPNDPAECDLRFTTIFDLVKGDTTKVVNGDTIPGNRIDLSAGGTFDIAGALRHTPSGKQQWVYNKFKVNDIFIDGSFPGVPRIEGRLSFYEEDPLYGKGFRGMVGIDFKAFGSEVGLDAVAQFGSKGTGGANYKYFFVDMLANLQPGIPMGGLEMTGFGGGVYYKMTRDPNLMEGLPEEATGIPSLPGLGESISGVKYLPSSNAGIGVKLTVALQTKLKPEAFSANGSFEMAFNANGGLSKVWIEGNGRFMDEVKIGAPPFKQAWGTPPNNGAAVSANVDIEMAFTDGFMLDGKLDVHVAAGGVLTGRGAAELYVGPDGWFVNIGTPSTPVFLNAAIAGTDFLTLTSYLDIGTKIPKMPDLPNNVRAITGLGNIMGNENTRATGRGFAFGAAFEVGTGGRKYFPPQTPTSTPVYFYGEVGGGAGFDIMLQDYGDAICAGSGQKIGINGWYASGQAWAYIRANVGVGVKVFGKQKEFDVLDLSAAAALQMKLPNPFVAKGAVGGRYRLLGGLVKGKINFQFTLGEACKISGGQDPASDLNIILNTYPEDGAEGVSPDTKPNVTFNLPLDEEFTMTDIQGNAVKLRAKLEFKQLRSGGTDMPVVFEMNEDQTYLQLKPFNMLPPNETLEFEIRATLYDGNTIVKTEHQTITFNTGSALDVIPAGNVVASYPLEGQYNFYKEEHKEEKGYLLLASGQPEIFDLNVGEVIVAQFTPNTGGDPIITPVTYVLQDYWQPVKVEFEMPSYSFQNETYYKISLIKGQEADIFKSNSRGQTNQYVLTNPPPKELYTSYFRTSKYNRFFDKINVIESSISGISKAGWDVTANVLQNEEPFDFYELSGSVDAAPLISVRLDEYESGYRNWYTQTLRPMIYDLLPVDDAICGYGSDTPISEEEEEDGEDASNDVYFSQAIDDNQLLVDEEIFNDPSGIQLPQTQRFYFKTIGGYLKDYGFFKTQLQTFNLAANSECVDEQLDLGRTLAQAEMTCNNRLNNCLGDFKPLIENPFPVPPAGINYGFMIQYQLPGTEILTSQKKILMNIP